VPSVTRLARITKRVALRLIPVNGRFLIRDVRDDRTRANARCGHCGHKEI